MSKIYIHNPRCSKSRQGLNILSEKGIKFEIHEYLKTPLTKKTLGEIYAQLIKTYSVKEFTRTKEKLFKELKLDLDSINTKDKWVNLIHEHPVFLERPILFSKSKAIVGRPPEDLLK